MQRSSLSSCYGDCRDWTQVVRFHSKHFYPLSSLDAPKVFIVRTLNKQTNTSKEVQEKLETCTILPTSSHRWQLRSIWYNLKELCRKFSNSLCSCGCLDSGEMTRFTGSLHLLQDGTHMLPSNIDKGRRDPAARKQWLSSYLSYFYYLTKECFHRGTFSGANTPVDFLGIEFMFFP